MVKAIAPSIRGPSGAIAVAVAPPHTGALEATAADATDHLDEEVSGPTGVVVTAPSHPFAPVLGELRAIVSRLVKGPSSTGTREGTPYASGATTARATGASPPIGVQVPRVVNVAVPRPPLATVRGVPTVAPTATAISEAPAGKGP